MHGGDTLDYQIRRYQIDPAAIDAFVDAWLNGVVPLRERFGFRFHGAWVLEESSEFVWIMSYDGPEGFAAADAAYYASAERRALSPDPAGYIRSTEEATARRVL